MKKCIQHIVCLLVIPVLMIDPALAGVIIQTGIPVQARVFSEQALAEEPGSHFMQAFSRSLPAAISREIPRYQIRMGALRRKALRLSDVEIFGRLRPRLMELSKLKEAVQLYRTLRSDPRLSDLMPPLVYPISIFRGTTLSLLSERRGVIAIFGLNQRILSDSISPFTIVLFLRYMGDVAAMWGTMTAEAINRDAEFTRTLRTILKPSKGPASKARWFFRHRRLIMQEEEPSTKPKKESPKGNAVQLSPFSVDHLECLRLRA